jgi:FPC/CPF motif-containing protein YcgG
MTQQPDYIAAFSQVVGRSCSFAERARSVFATSYWNSTRGLRENLGAALPSLNTFMQRQETERLDAWIFAIPNPVYASSVATLASTAHTILAFLADHDPFRSQGLTDMIETPEWEFYYAGVGLFVIAFAPCYPPSHPRWSCSTSTTYFLFQPVPSFERLGVHTDERSWKLRQHIRFDFARRGIALDEALMETSIEAYKYVKPVDIGAPPVKWWRFELVTD